MATSGVKARSGKGGRILIGGTTLKLKQWSATWRGDDQDTTNHESEGYEEGEIGVEVVEFSFEGDWDAGVNMFDDPPGIFPRNDLTQVKLYENVDDDVFWNFDYVRVLSATNSCPVRGTVTFSASCKSQGTFDPPEGSVA